MTYKIKDFENAMRKIVFAKLKIKYTVTDSEEYGTLEAITNYSNDNEGRLMIWKGASDETIFSRPAYNWMFRAWHDHHHVKRQYAFNEQGEYDVFKEQVKDVDTYIRPLDEALADYMIMLLDAEVNGQVQAFLKDGAFISDQKQFAIDFVSKKYNKRISV